MFIPSSSGWSWHNIAFFVVVLLYFSCKPSLIAIGALESDSFCKLSATMWAHQVRWVGITEIPWSGINAWAKKYVKYDQLWLKSLYPCCSHQTSPLSFIFIFRRNIADDASPHKKIQQNKLIPAALSRLTKRCSKLCFSMLHLGGAKHAKHFCQGLDHHLFNWIFMGI